MRRLLLLAAIARACDGSRGAALAAALRKPPGTPAVLVRLNCADLRADTSDADGDLAAMSERLREAGVDALILRGASEAQARAVIEEQRMAASSYPGPCPVLLQPSTWPVTGGLAPDLNDELAALVLPEGAAEADAPADAALASSLQLVPQVWSVDELRQCSGRAPLAILTPAFSSALLDAEAEAAGAVAAHDGAVVAALPPGLEAASRRARALRAAGCAGVLIDDDAAVGQPEVAVREVLSKASEAFGSYGLKMGFSSFMSDQYWLNKDIKEAKRSVARQRNERGEPPLEL